MSTSRKLRAKLAKHRCSSRKATSTEAARKEPVPEPIETQASTERGTVTARSALTGTQFVCFLPLAVRPKIICRTQAHRGSRRLEPLRAASLGRRNVPHELPQQVGSVKSLAVCLSHSPSEIWPNTHFVFYPAVSSPRKRKCQATAADPDRETTSPSDSDTSSTVGTSTSEGEDEKDFILPDYPSDKLTSSESSESEPEEAPAENLSTGWSERVTRVDTQFHGDHVGPQNIPDHINHESTALSFLELCLHSSAAKQTCEPSRSSPLHTMPRILSPSLSPS